MAFSPYVPEDFDAFWADALLEAREVPLNFRRSVSEVGAGGHLVERIKFQGMDERALSGWIAFPEGARKLPSFLWLAPYGWESKLPDVYGTRAGMVSMSFNFHGRDAFLQERYIAGQGYFARGAGFPETWIFRQMIQDALIAARVLQAQIEVDEDRIGAMGMSQGGGMSIWLGALSPIIKAVVADMPFLAAMPLTLDRGLHRYPLKELGDFMARETLGEAKVRHTVSYFDTVNFATRCEKPTLVSLGLKDPASRPENVRAAFEALPGPKRLVEYDWGHDWHEPMIANNREWLIEHLG